MRWLLLRAATLWSVLTLVVGTPLVASRAQPPPIKLDMLRLGDCPLPCWIGIWPGETTLDAARERIAAVFGRSGEYRVTFERPLAFGQELLIVRSARPLIVLYMTLDTQGNRVVTRIRFQFYLSYLQDGPAATVADLHRLFGAPSRAAVPDSRFRRQEDFAVVYGDAEQGALVFARPGSAGWWDQRVTSLTLYGRGSEPLPRAAGLRPWRGFVPLESYYAYYLHR
jgi:hypothetical protein